MFDESLDFKTIPSNPLKDLIIFEERIQHNLNSLHRLRFQALLRIFLAFLAFGVLLYIYLWTRSHETHQWISWISLLGSGFFLIVAVFFLVHSLYSRRLTLLNRYRSQCRKVLRMYNLDLRYGLDSNHTASIPANMSEYHKAIRENKSGYFLTIKRRIAGKAYDLLEAYRIENWKWKLKRKQS